MLTPMIAITLPRTPSRLRSAARARPAPDTAPMPCRARPATTIFRLAASAATKPPAANSSRPRLIAGRRPMRSESSPKGTCSTAWPMP